MIETAWFLNYLGTVTGAIGVLIAIYLQLISPKHCPPQYVMFYLTVGSGLMLIHINGALVSDLTATILRLAGYTVLMAVQVGSAYYIYQKLDKEDSVETLEDALTLHSR